MKGLLIKDLMLLKSQGRFFAVTVILIFIAGGVFDGSYAYFGYYLMLFQALFVVNTMSMDEENGGMCFLMTLPAGRKAYVREKFCFGMLMTAAGWALSVLIAIFFTAIKHDPADLTDLLPMAAGGLAVFPMINFVSVPLILKFGQEKGRIALAAVFMGLFGGLLLLLRSKAALSSGMDQLMLLFTRYRIAAWAAGLLLYAALVLACYCLAVRIMAKKEF